MKQKVYILMLAFTTLVAEVNAQSSNPMNDKPANVKICNSSLSKLVKDMTFYKADGSCHQRSDYEYNKDGLLSSESELKWNKKTNNWKNYKKNIHIYDTENRLIEKTSFFWNNDNWADNSKKIPAYNSKGFISEELYYDWNQITDDWNQATIKYTYIYDAEGLQTEYMQQLKKASSDAWNDPNWKVVYTRNPAGQVTEELGLSWNNETLSWKNSCKYVYNYDASKHRMNVYYYIWKEDQWIEDQMTICIYDNDGSLERAEYYRSFDDSSLDAYCIYNYTTRDSSSEATNSTAIITEQISIYPNPATNYIDLRITSTLVNKTANLYDTAGKLIKSIPLKNEVTRIDISQFSGGIYLIKIDDQTFKILKR